jgi:hypothetical protein
MKLICLNKDNCGTVVKISTEEEHDNTCPVCFGVAAVYTDTYSPLINETFDENIDHKINNILASVHNLISQKLGNPKQSESNEDNKNEN